MGAAYSFLNMNNISQAAIDLMAKYETGGRAYYEKVYKSGPCWPQGRSGITIGVGYDLGYETTLRDDWSDKLSSSDLARLSDVTGLTGQHAQSELSHVRGIVIPWDVAMDVFMRRTLPREVQATLRTFPGCDEKLSSNAFGALVSLVYNRGESLAGDRRDEMRHIHDAILANVGSTCANPNQDLLAYIAKEFISMRRLWPHVKGSDGDLWTRRGEEAALVTTPDVAAKTQASTVQA